MDTDQTEQLGLEPDDTADPAGDGPSEAFQVAVGAVVVLFLLVALVGVAMRGLGGGGEQQVGFAAPGAATQEGTTDETASGTATPSAPGETAAPSASASAQDGTGAGVTEPAATEPEDPAARIIGDAPPPEDTSVQLLDGVRDEDRMAEARQVLDDFGYPVVAESRARSTYGQTTVFYVEGAGPAGLGLRARDPRFTVVEPAPDSLSADVDLHVIVGEDWPSG